MEKLYRCTKCTTSVVIEQGMKEEYFGPTIRCGMCNTIMVMSSITITPHIIPTRPMRTLYWTGALTSFPPLTIEPLIIEDVIHWTFPPLPGK